MGARKCAGSETHHELRDAFHSRRKRCCNVHHHCNWSSVCREERYRSLMGRAIFFAPHVAETGDVWFVFCFSLSTYCTRPTRGSTRPLPKTSGALPCAEHRKRRYNTEAMDRIRWYWQATKAGGTGMMKPAPKT